jgi:hypothetical protein
MPSNEVRLNKVQAGFETVPGTAVAATRKMYMRMDPANGVNVPLVWFDDATGSYLSRQRATKGRTTVAWPGTDLATFEDLHFWLHMMVEGTPNESTGTDPSVLVHEFVPDTTADTLRSITTEWGDPGNAYEISQTYMNSWTLRGDADSDSEPGWMLEADFIGRTFDPTTFTPALADRFTEVITARGTQVFIDDTSATVGTTQLLGQVISASISGNINRHTKAFAEDEFYVAQGVTGRQGWTVDAQMTLEFADDAEFANYRSTTPVFRAVRFRREGTEIATGENKALEIDLFGYWSAVGTGDREGNKTITLSLQAGTDVTEATDSRFTITNDQAAM